MTALEIELQGGVWSLRAQIRGLETELHRKGELITGLYDELHNAEGMIGKEMESNLNLKKELEEARTTSSNYLNAIRELEDTEKALRAYWWESLVEIQESNRKIQELRDGQKQYLTVLDQKDEDIAELERHAKVVESEYDELQSELEKLRSNLKDTREDITEYVQKTGQTSDKHLIYIKELEQVVSNQGREINELQVESARRHKAWLQEMDVTKYLTYANNVLLDIRDTLQADLDDLEAYNDDGGDAA